MFKVAPPLRLHWTPYYFQRMFKDSSSVGNNEHVSEFKKHWDY